MILDNSSGRKCHPDSTVPLRQIPGICPPRLGHHRLWHAPLAQPGPLDIQRADVRNHHLQHCHLHNQQLLDDPGSKDGHVLWREICPFWVPIHVDTVRPDDGHGSGWLFASVQCVSCQGPLAYDLADYRHEQGVDQTGTEGDDSGLWKELDGFTVSLTLCKQFHAIHFPYTDTLVDTSSSTSQPCPCLCITGFQDIFSRRLAPSIG